MADSAPDKVAFELVTPTELVHSAEADMVVVPGSEGDFGVLPGHTPLVTAIRPGVVDIYDAGTVAARLFVAGGFAEATPERCTVLASEAVPVAEIDAEAVAGRIAVARQAISDAEDDEAREAAEATLAVAEAMQATVRGA